MSREVAAVYVDESRISRFHISAQATVNELKQRSHSELARTAQEHYGLKNLPCGDTVLSSGSHGYLDLEPSATVSLFCRPNEVILAAVPAPLKDHQQANTSSPFLNTLTSPIGNHFTSMLDILHTNIERLQEALEAEKHEQREEVVHEREEQRQEVAREREERRKEYESLQNHLLEVEEMTMDTVGWITMDDTKMLDRIKLRHLLNKAQEKLAIAAGLTSQSFGASLAWRAALGPSNNLQTRLAQAQTLLHDSGVELNQSTQDFISSPEGFRMAVEATSSIHQHGDNIAHPISTTHAQFNKAITRHPHPAEISGLQSLLNFVSTR